MNVSTSFKSFLTFHMLQFMKKWYNTNVSYVTIHFHKRSPWFSIFHQFMRNDGKIVYNVLLTTLKNEQCKIVYWALYNCLLSSVKLSTEHCTIVYWKIEALYYCLLKKRGTGQLSSFYFEHCTIVYWSLYNCLHSILSTVKLSTEYCRIVFTLFWALYICLLSTVKLSTL